MEVVVVLHVDYQFSESLSEQAALEQGLLPPAGIANIINSCYANSVIQVLHQIPDLNEAIKNCAVADSAAGTPGALVSHLQDTFSRLDSSTTVLKPFNLLNVLFVLSS